MKKHPAKFSDEVLAEMAKFIPDHSYVLDPFAGIGRVHELARDGAAIHTIGIEIEPDWAKEHPDTKVADATELPFDDEIFDIVATSPTYGNRMADSHNAQDDSKRVTYTHVIGHKLKANNSGAMQWGDKYRQLHLKAWREVRRVLKPNGLFLLNVSDHIRGGNVVDVTGWHKQVVEELGFECLEVRPILTRRMRFGANADARVANEMLFVFRRPGGIVTEYAKPPQKDQRVGAVHD